MLNLWADPPIPTIGQTVDGLSFLSVQSRLNCGLTLRSSDRRCAPTPFGFWLAGMALIK